MNQLASSDAYDGMLRMSILEHLEELRSRIIRALIGFGLCLLASMALARPLWTFVQRPLKDAIAHVHGDALHIAGDLGHNVDFLIRFELRGEYHPPR
jgi:Sec-independent protein secretion pathway component TatC